MGGDRNGLYKDVYAASIRTIVAHELARFYLVV